MKHPVLRALLLSLLLHFVIFGGMELAYRVGLTKQASPLSYLVEELQKQNAALEQEKQQNSDPNQNEEPPLLFVDVDASQADEKPPEDSKYYAVVNTRAANAEKQVESLAPNLKGSQEIVPKVVETAKPSPEQQKPSPPKPEPTPALPEPKPQPEVPREAPAQPVVEPQPQESKPPVQPGETLLAAARPVPKTSTEQKPRTNLEPQKPAEPEQPRPRPRTLADARHQKGLIEGPRMRQDGGVGRIAMESVDARATPFGAYDAALIAAVQARWYTLLEDRDLVRNQSGRVVVEFRLHSDGRVTNLRVAQSQVSETLGWICQRAVLDPNPYAPFPSDLRRMLKTDYREVRFSFHYTN